MATAQASEHGGQAGPSVYTLSNQTGGNEVVRMHRTSAGILEVVDRVSTGGTGTGAGLGSQGALVLDRASRVLLAVNAGSNTVSLFDVARDGHLRLADTVPSGGRTPVSVTTRGELAYVLNSGSNDISGFRVDGHHLVPIAGSTRALGGSGGAQVSFTPDGRRLVVTEKATNTIDVFPVKRSGAAGAPVTNPSVGQTPFGFAFGQQGALIVSNAVGGAKDASSVSTYRVGRDNRLQVLDASVATTETAACWVVAYGPYAYTTNTGSGTVSGLRIGANGHATLLQPDGVTATTGAGPIDAAAGAGELFTLNSGSHTITVDRIERNGSLTPEGFVGGLVPGTVGLAVR
jgi:6-phosphogluconolactonase (cycloisomerase 2 family)